MKTQHNDPSSMNNDDTETLLFEALMSQPKQNQARPETFDLSVPFEVIQLVVAALPNDLRAAIVCAALSIRDKAMKASLDSLTEDEADPKRRKSRK